MENTDFIPANATFNDILPANIEELLPMVRFIYDKVFVLVEPNEQEPDRETFTVQLRYLNQSLAQINVACNNWNVKPELRPKPGIIGLWQFLMRILNPGFLLTRAIKNQLGTHLTNNEKNNALGVLANDLITERINPPRQVGLPAFSVYETLEETLSFSTKILKVIIDKTILAKQLYTLTHSFISEIPQLKAKIAEMLLTLADRNEVNTFAISLVKDRQDACEIYQQYISKTMESLHHRFDSHLGHGYHSLESRVFNYQQFVGYFQNKTIWTEQCFEIQTQLQSLLEDETILEQSRELDAAVADIRAYRPSREHEILEKRNRLLHRINSAKREYQKFQNSENKTVARAKLLIDSFHFLNKEGESLSLDGVQYDENNTGLDTDTVATIVEELAAFVEKQEEKRKRDDIAMKLSSSEYTRSIPAQKLPKLDGPASYLHWFVVYTNMEKIITNDMSKVCLIKASLVNKVDRSFLETCYDPKQCIEYLKRKYSDRTYILSFEINKLISLPLCGHDIGKMLKNSEILLCSIGLLKSHRLINKIDRSIRDKLFDRVFTVNQREIFSFEAIKIETEWSLRDKERAAAVPASQSTNTGAVAAVTSTPDTTLTDDDDLIFTEEGILQPSASQPCVDQPEEDLMERRRLAFFLKMHGRFYESARRLFYSELVMENKHPEFKNHNRRNFNYKIESDPPDCPANCKVEHSSTLAKCDLFLDMNYQERQRIVSNTSPGLFICKKCLFFGKSRDEHQTNKFGKCPAQVKYNLHCRFCHNLGEIDRSLTHSHLLCRAKHHQSKSNPRGRGSRPRPGRGGRGRGRPQGPGNGSDTSGPSAPPGPEQGRGSRGRGSRGRRGRGNQFKRMTRKSRLSASEKIYQTGAEAEPSENLECYDSQCEAHSCHVIQTIDSNYRVHEQDIHRQVLSCASSCTFLSSNFNLQGIAMYDTASSLSFVRLSIAQQLQLPAVGNWNGNLSTLTSKEYRQFPVFVATLAGVNDEIFKIPVLGVNDIGSKEENSTKAINLLCKYAGICKSNLDQVCGPVSILVGIDAMRLFPKTIRPPNERWFNHKAPDCKMFLSKLSNKMFFAGTFGKEWSNELKESKSNYMVSGRGSLFSSNIKNKNKNKLTVIIDPETRASPAASLTLNGDGGVTPTPALPTSPPPTKPKSAWVQTWARPTASGKSVDAPGVGGAARETPELSSPSLSPKARDHYYCSPSSLKDTSSVYYKGNRYRVLTFKCTENSCFLGLQCQYQFCRIHKTIDEFKTSTSLPDDLRNTDYVRMGRFEGKL